MAIGMVSAFGKAVDAAVDMTRGAEGISWVRPGLGMYMGAQLDGAGVAGGVQLEMSSIHRIKRKERCMDRFTGIGCGM